MKFQDDISMTHTYTRTSRNQYVPPCFQSWGHNECVIVIHIKNKDCLAQFVPDGIQGQSITMNHMYCIEDLRHCNVIERS